MSGGLGHQGDVSGRGRFAATTHAGQQAAEDAAAGAAHERVEDADPSTDADTEPAVDEVSSFPAQPPPGPTPRAAPDHFVGGCLTPYEIGEPGRAATEVVARVTEDPTEPADTQLDSGVAGPFVVRAASSRGLSHRHAGTPRQDDYALSMIDGGWLIVAVADGVSAGRLSHRAATLACRAAVSWARDRLVATSTDEHPSLPWSEMLSAIAARIVAHGRRVLAEDGRRADDVTPQEVADAMATTLVVCVLPMHRGADGAYRGSVVSIGDTAAFLLEAGGQWTPVTAIKNEGAEIASSRVVALPFLHETPADPIPVVLRPEDVLFVMTDGVGDPLGNGGGDVGRILAREWATPPEPLSFAGQISFARRSFDDDRTVVGVWVADGVH